MGWAETRVSFVKKSVKPPKKVDFLEESLRDDDGLIGRESRELLMLFTED